MAHGKPIDVRDNFGRFQKQATINLTKRLQKTAAEVRKNIQETIATELKKIYIANIEASYTSSDYIHTNTLVENIGVEIEEPNLSESKVKIVLMDGMYPNGRTVSQVHEYLTKGTSSSNNTYKFYDEGDSVMPWKTAESHDTPKHDFELHTQLQMKGFLESLDPKDFSKKK